MKTRVQVVGANVEATSSSLSLRIAGVSIEASGDATELGAAVGRALRGLLTASQLSNGLVQHELPAEIAASEMPAQIAAAPPKRKRGRK